MSNEYFTISPLTDVSPDSVTSNDKAGSSSHLTGQKYYDNIRNVDIARYETRLELTALIVAGIISRRISKIIDKKQITEGTR